MLDIRTLDTTNPCYDPEHWQQQRALVKGGKHFRALLPTFLPQNPVEPGDVYAQRLLQAHYRSYVGSIINLYVGWLFSSAFAVKAFKRNTDEPIPKIAPFYGQFQEDVGNEVQITDFMKERFRNVLTHHTAAWLVELPSNGGEEPNTAAEYEERKLGRATLKAIECDELFDWELDEKGAFKWVMIHTCFETRESWVMARDSVTETWSAYDKEFVYTYQIKYPVDKRPDPKTTVAVTVQPHGFKRVPLVRMHIPEDLCIGEQTFDTQLEQFRLDNALSWLTRRTCFAQPVFNLEDGENPPRMGAGYAIMLGAEDKMGWTSPPVAPFDVLQKNVDNKRDEIYRIVHQMAQSVDNNAETVGRSADSKEIDAAATRVMLNEYGKFMMKPIEETYEIISEARGETDYEWSVEGLAGYDTATVASLIANAKEAGLLGVPSKTFHKVLKGKVAMAMLPEVDQRVKDTIRSEIEDAEIELGTTLDVAHAKNLEAKSTLDLAKAHAEEIKAKAAVKAPARPVSSPAGAMPTKAA